MDKYASKLTSLQEKLQVWLHFFSLDFALLYGGDGDGKIKSANLTFILQGLGYIALPERHVLPKIYLEDVSWGEVIKDISQCLVVV